jgi:hypothetical protein
MRKKIIIFLSLLNFLIIINNIKAQTLEHLDSIKFIRYEKALNWIKFDDSIKIHLDYFNENKFDTLKIRYKVSYEIMNFDVSSFADEIMNYEFKNQNEAIREYLEVSELPRTIEEDKSLNRFNDADSIIRKKLGDIPCDSFKTIIRNAGHAILVHSDEYWNYGVFFSRIIKNRLRAEVVHNRHMPLCLGYYLNRCMSSWCEILFYFDDNNSIIKVFRKCFTN